jgi:hypothetical protein
MLDGPILEMPMPSIRMIAFVVAALPVAAANSQDLNGSFSTGHYGETFKVQGHGDGTADVYDGDGQLVGQAEDNGFGHWDIHTSRGGRLGEIQEHADGTFDVNDSDGRPWGSGTQKPMQ